jgi:CheY-like chemotaxis protein
VLVAEDNQFNADLVQLLLVRRGLMVRVVTTGQEALDVLERERSTRFSPAE